MYSAYSISEVFGAVRDYLEYRKGHDPRVFEAISPRVEAALIELINAIEQQKAKEIEESERETLRKLKEKYE